MQSLPKRRKTNRRDFYLYRLTHSLRHSSFVVALMTPTRIIFMGTPELAAVSLRTLVASRAFDLAAVVTQPDQPKGRGLKLQPSPVKEVALKENLPVLQPERAREENFIQQLAALQPELIAVAAYGQILPKAILDLPRFGCLNVHTSLLPKYRGAAPIQHAILHGDSETGVTIMKMDVGLDTGDILTQERTPIAASDNSQTLHDRLAAIGAALLVRTIPEFISGAIRPRPQPAEGVTHAPKIKKHDGEIDWSQPAPAIWNRVRALVPWPGAFTHLLAEPNPHLLKIWNAEVVECPGTAGEMLQADKNDIVIGCGTGALRVLTLQREGGRQMTAAEFLAGHPLRAGQKVGNLGA
jgi:methionyl-tRNA formyltransferase